MKYNPDKHHRRSVRLQGYDYASPGAYFVTICVYQRQCLFGAIMDGEMRLNGLGQMVYACWQRLPSHFPNLVLDAFVVMPNHVHGILVLTKPAGRGAALGQGLEGHTKDSCPNATPTSNSSRPGVAFGREMIGKTKEQLPNATPLPPRLVAGSVGSIVLNFKSVTTRSRNHIQRSPGALMWQRNYYDHIIRNEASLQRLRQYIQNNPLSWQQDQLHPDVSSKW
jgi:REP element-mobilizing transposase RayT